MKTLDNHISSSNLGKSCYYFSSQSCFVDVIQVVCESIWAKYEEMHLSDLMEIKTHTFDINQCSYLGNKMFKQGLVL